VDGGMAPEANESSGGAAMSLGPLWWASECHGVLYSLAVMLLSLAFVGFLAWQARRSFCRLSYDRSHVRRSRILRAPLGHRRTQPPLVLPAGSDWLPLLLIAKSHIAWL
jgi:hypothetical protein